MDTSKTGWWPSKSGHTPISTMWLLLKIILELVPKYMAHFCILNRTSCLKRRPVCLCLHLSNLFCNWEFANYFSIHDLFDCSLQYYEAGWSSLVLRMYGLSAECQVQNLGLSIPSAILSSLFHYHPWVWEVNDIPENISGMTTVTAAQAWYEQSPENACDIWWHPPLSGLSVMAQSWVQFLTLRLQVNLDKLFWLLQTSVS